MKVVAFVPAKGTSSRIENKNTRLLDGKPLFLYTLEKPGGLSVHRRGLPRHRVG